MDDPIPHEPPPRFTPVPLLRNYASAWTADVQIAFIHELSRTGVVAAAARSVGRAPRSAYQLRKRAGAESFGDAWDFALEQALRRSRQFALQHARAPLKIARFRRGKLIGWTERFDDRYAMTALRAYYAAMEGRLAPHQKRLLDRAPAILGRDP